MLSLRPLCVDILLIVGYLVATRIFSLSAAKIGIQIGPVPIFLTDITLLLLLLYSMLKRPTRMLYWLSAGEATTGAGRAVWLLCGISVVYFVLSFGQYKIMAVHDLAIFVYSLFFPLTYLAITNRMWAIRITRYCIYSGIVLAVMILIQKFTGIHMGLEILEREINGAWVGYVGGDDYGAICASAMMGLIAYGMLDRRYRSFHLIGALLCFVALAANGARSAVVACAVAGAVTFLLLSTKYRLTFCIVTALLLCLVLAANALPDTVPGVPALHGMYAGINSALSGASDADAKYRIGRWKDAFGVWLAHPVFGLGYGKALLNQAYIGVASADKFNLGMPHNTYLFLLARMGLVGFGLVVFAMALGMYRLGSSVLRYRLADDLAALNVLVALASYAAFVLFFERPMNNAGYWIMLAVGFRLAETSRGAMMARLALPRFMPVSLRARSMAALEQGVRAPA